MPKHDCPVGVGATSATVNFQWLHSASIMTSLQTQVDSEALYINILQVQEWPIVMSSIYSPQVS